MSPTVSLKLPEETGSGARLTTSLLMMNLVAPELKVLPRPFSFQLGLKEFVLLGGLSSRDADLFLRLAARLHHPEAGQILHWGQDLFALPRPQRYQQRGRMAFVSPFQSLLPRLTLGENLVLAKTLTTPISPAAVLDRYQDLWERLQLLPWLQHYPRELPPLCYQLALWGRELTKDPDLILGLLPYPEGNLTELSRILGPVLINFQARQSGALLLAGPALEFALPVADRLVQASPCGWQEYPLPGRARHSLLRFLPLS